jgi:hypothetical protein
MPDIVAAGATLQCAMGTVPAPLNIVPGHTVTVDYRPAATTLDFMPMVNIPTFGMCQSLANPTVAAATAAAFGVLTPMPCMPATASPWTPGSPTVTVSGRTLLGSTSTCMCTWGGTVSILQSATVSKSSG